VADAVNSALVQASISLDDVDFLDFYSCFPAAPRIIREELKIRPQDPRDLTVTGGMPYFGGPGNNYALHAICAMVQKLRERPESFGLVQALSWYISKHSVGLYSGIPGKTPWMPSEGMKPPSYPRAQVIVKASGKAVVESYAIVYDRENHLQEAIIIGTQQSGNRFIARVNPADDLLEQMSREEIIGVYGNVEYDESMGINWFHPY
jgi:acetyl-CoA C-acetyltransferase